MSFDIIKGLPVGRMVGERWSPQGITPDLPARTAQGNSGGLAAEAAAAWSALTAARDEYAEEVPCLGRDEWTSDRPADRKAAAAACAGCPVIAECSAYAVAGKEKWNVWAGHDLKTPAGRKHLALTITRSAA